ncbi:hypothetical protein RU93_GL000913 [Enterococcus aquimarinus]|uniref:Uncharacterized protein n=1 Tax=Enterococcus aquimarinus TaxID=328396 RepID=A0A1L8QNW2_9ENTE|nr:hypothetical protein RU93_GL000913 [Enterococcus aquimarinus]
MGDLFHENSQYAFYAQGIAKNDLLSEGSLWKMILNED